MRIERADLDEAIAQQILTGPQAAALWRLLQLRQPVAAVSPVPAAESPARRFDGPNVAYYFGALLVIGAMGWLMTLGWEKFGGQGIFLIATLYAFRSEEHTSELQSRRDLVCRLLLEKKKKKH